LGVDAGGWVKHEGATAATPRKLGL
jgi:hypothetical protein